MNKKAKFDFGITRKSEEIECWHLILTLREIRSIVFKVDLKFLFDNTVEALLASTLVSDQL